MPIQVQFDANVPTLTGPGGNFPVFVCDACGQRIDDGTKGVYLVRPEADNPGPPSNVAFAHKGPCHRKLEGTGDYSGWHELRTFLRLLAMNARLGDVIDKNAFPD
jgi:hypothetical protein